MKHESYQDELPRLLTGGADLKIVLNDAGGLDAGLDDVLVIGHVVVLEDGLAAVEEVLGALHQLEAVAATVGGLQGLALPQPRDPRGVLRMQVLP